MKTSEEFDVFVSIVAPLRDAGSFVRDFLVDLERIANSLFTHFEIVLVDDASADQTVSLIREIQQTVGNIQLYCLARRSGFDAALIAGLDNSIGDFVFTLNPQSDPVDLLPKLWTFAREGAEVVCGVRANPAHRRLYALASRRFSSLLNASTGLRIPPGLSDLRLYSRRVVSYITQNNDRHLLLKLLPFWAAYRVKTIEYAPLSRDGGFPSGRSFLNALVTGITILLSSSVKPLRLLTLFALAASSLSLSFAIYVVAVALFKTHVMEGWISLALPMAVMFFFVSAILGILSEYIFLLFQETSNRPVYMIAHESTSSALEIQRRLNVVEGGGLADKEATGTTAAPVATLSRSGIRPA
jgi:polyisoprenyl-phosphate glycosyltransferase